MSSWLGNNSNSGKGGAENAADLDQKGKQILLVSDEKEENDNGFIATIAIGAVAAIAVAGLAAWGIGSLLAGSSSSSTTDKTMKAPGRNYRIPRDFFEEDPAGYFRNLRKS